MDEEEEEEEVSSSASSLPTLTTDSNNEEPGPSTSTKPPKPSAKAIAKRLDAIFTEHDVDKWYSDAYREMFNVELTSELLSFENSPPPLAASQIRMSAWSSEEKDRFFRLLTRHGRHNFSAVFKNVDDKSEAEVLDYFLLLQRAASEIELLDNGFLGRQYYKIPAAVEVGDECCRRLDLAARALSYNLFEHEAAVAKAADPQNGIISAESLESYQRGNQEQEEAHKMSGRDVKPQMSATAAHQTGVEAALDLFKVENWLKLSTQVFMNSSDMDYNWTSVAPAGNSPSIFGNSPSIFGIALSDFRNIAETITRRIVATSIFHARSRIRANDAPGRLPVAGTVRSSDVRSALDALNWLPRKHDYWVDVPRRNKLHVYDAPLHTRNVSRSRLLSYEEVETRLRLPVQPRTHSLQHSEVPAADRSLDISNDDDDDDESGLGAPDPLSYENLQRHTEFSQSSQSSFDEENQPYEPHEAEPMEEETDASSSTLSSLLSSPSDHPPRQPARRRKDWVQLEDERIAAETSHLERRDARHSALEEAHIWRTVFKRKRAALAFSSSSSSSSASDSDSDRPRRKRPRRRRRSRPPRAPPNRFPEQDAWRDTTRPRAAWHDIGYVVPADAFADRRHSLLPVDPAILRAAANDDASSSSPSITDSDASSSSPSPLELGASALDEAGETGTDEGATTEDEASDAGSASTAVSRRSNPARSTRSQSPAYVFRAASGDAGVRGGVEDDESADEYEPDNEDDDGDQ